MADVTQDIAGGRAASISTTAAVAVALAATIGFGALLPAVSAGDTLRLAWDWLPALGVRLGFYVDGLSLLFALLISGIGVLVMLYAGSYLRSRPQLPRLQLLLVLFMAAMLGLVLSDNLISLFVFWELTTITSFLLIGFDQESAKARQSALQALFITGAGGLALLAGLILMGQAVGSYDISAIVQAGDILRAHPLYLPILILVLLGAFTKSAQFPFHFWLPGAMAAPTPVSAYLHSATMVKAGVYLLARLHPALAGTEAWFLALTVAGAVTAVWASLMALRQSDLKLMLAWTTLMALGTLVMFLGSEASVAIAAAITFLLVHALYKCALFLVVGAVDHATGTRDLERLGGLARTMPVTAAAACIAALSMAGFPPFLGFIGKELKYEGALAIAEEPFLIAGAAVSANAMMVCVAGLVSIRVFFGRSRSLPRKPHEVPLAMWPGPALLAALGLTLGLLPEMLGGGLVQPAVAAILGRPEEVQLALWHGINLPLALSVLTAVLGLFLFWQYQRARRGLDAIAARLPLSGDQAYAWMLDGLKALAGAQTRFLQHGALSGYAATVFGTFALAVGATLLLKGGLAWPAGEVPIPALGWFAAFLVAAAALTVVLATSRLLAICALGLAGAGIALVFLLFGGIDVAMTQLLVETLFVVIIALLLPKLPSLVSAPRRGRARAFVDGFVATSCGGVIAALTLAVADVPIDRFISDFHEQASVTEAHGRNIVNVMLVDFRALDTLGEIAVVAIAALAVVALIKLRPGSAAEGAR